MKSYSLRILIAACICSISILASAADQVFEHVVTEDETPWFLATVYYGKGSDYTKLLSANKLQRAEDMREGMKIRVLNPKFNKKMSGFSERYAKLWEERQKALGLTKQNSAQSTKVVLPAESIRHHDTTPVLPFAEVKDTGKSPAELAREELLKHSRQAGQGE